MGKALFTKGGGEQIAVAPFQMRMGRVRSRADAWTWAMRDLIAQHPGARALEITLTYRKKDDWKPDHISRYLDKLRKRYTPQQLMAYAWVAELQERGAVHYHLLVVIAKEVFIDTPDLSGDWAHGWSSIKRKKDISARYLVKYLQKGDQKDESCGGYPKGIRIFAVTVRLLAELAPRTRFDYLISGWPKYVRDETRSLREKLAIRGEPAYSVRRVKHGKLVGNGWWYETLEGGGVKLHYKNIWWLVFSEWKYIGNDDLNLGNWGDGRQTNYEEMY